MRNLQLLLPALVSTAMPWLPPVAADPGLEDEEPAEVEAGPTDERVREAWSYLRPEERVDAIARFEAHAIWMESFQNSLIEYALANLEEDPGLLPEPGPLPYFDPELHAPGQPIRRKRAEGSRAERVVESLANYPRRMRPAWEYDWAEQRVVRTAEIADPERMFENALAGLPPRLDLAEALVLAMLDDGELLETHRAFGHAYTDRSGWAYPVTLYTAWCSGESLEMPDVDTLGIVHTLDDEWRRWKAPVSPYKLDDLYERIGEHFQDARRHRGLRVALARTFLVGSPDMRDGYDTHLLTMHALWNEHESTPPELAGELPEVKDWAKFLERWAKRVAKDEDLAEMAVYRRDLLDWEGYQVRNLMIGVLRDTGAFERTSMPPAKRKPRKPTARSAQPVDAGAGKGN